MKKFVTIFNLISKYGAIILIFLEVIDFAKEKLEAQQSKLDK